MEIKANTQYIIVVILVIIGLFINSSLTGDPIYVLKPGSEGTVLMWVVVIVGLLAGLRVLQKRI